MQQELKMISLEFYKTVLHNPFAYMDVRLSLPEFLIELAFSIPLLSLLVKLKAVTETVCEVEGRDGDRLIVPIIILLQLLE